MCPQNALPLRFSQDMHMQKIRYPEVDKRDDKGAKGDYAVSNYRRK